jgi:flavin reductase (DIM6/NTAB) family NADH-FMN oxidoreductase RutF
MSICENIKAIEEHCFVPSVETTRNYRNALGAFTTGVTVVTVNTPLGPMGMTVNSFTSVSLDPPLILWSAAKSSSRYEAFIHAKNFAIHVLGVDEDVLSARFTRNGLGFEGLDWMENADGVPVILGTLARFECTLESQYDAGDHTIIVGRVLRGALRQGEPLCFSRGSFGSFSENAKFRDS